MKMKLLGAALSILLSSGVAMANTACGEQFPPSITCMPFTHQFLVSLQGATRAEVIKAMNTNGRPKEPDRLIFMSNAESPYGGFINFKFKNDRAVIISGWLDKDANFIWNQASRFACSDLPDSHYPPCRR